MGRKRRPEFETTSIGVDQRALLELLGKPEIVGSRWIVLHHGGEPEHDGVPSIAPAHYLSRLCPVVRVLGRLRVVLPNGDLAEVQPDEIETVPKHWRDGGG